LLLFNINADLKTSDNIKQSGFVENSRFVFKLANMSLYNVKQAFTVANMKKTSLDIILAELLY